MLHRTSRIDWLRKLGPLGPLAVLAVAMPPISGILLIGTLHKVGPWLRAHDDFGLLLYIAAFTVLGGMALLPTYAQSLLGGWAFGLGPGLAAALAGFVGAALVSYAISWRLSGDRLEKLLEQHTRWNAVYRALLHSGFARAVFIITLLRLPPNSPFAATNLAMAAIKSPLGPLWMFPRKSISAVLDASESFGSKSANTLSWVSSVWATFMSYS